MSKKDNIEEILSQMKGQDCKGFTDFEDQQEYQAVERIRTIESKKIE